MKYLLLTIFCFSFADAYADRRRDDRSERRVDRTRRTERPVRVDRNRPNRPTRPVRVDRNRPNRPTRPVRVDRNRPNRPTRPVIVDRNRPNRPTRPVIVDRNRPNRPSIPAGRHYNPTRPDRRYYGTRRYHAPRNYVSRPYRRYRHNPYTVRYNHRVTYRYSRNYYDHVRVSYPDYIYVNWLLYPSSRMDGYVVVNGYPYYVYDGLRHRYSYYDSCNYELVDKYTHQVVMNFGTQACAPAYDQCAYERDRLNDMEYENRYFCAENIY